MGNLVTIAVEQLNEVGVVIVNLTCDNPTTNWSMLHGLGANLKANNLKVNLSLENTLGLPIYSIPDVVHCLKLARNAFGDYLVFEDGDGQKISWTYIIELNKLQEEKGLFLANKLRQEHIKWRSNKMNVRIAAQTISSSVADATYSENEAPLFENLQAVDKDDIYLNCVNSRTEYISDILTYISGAIHRQLNNGESCLECSKYLSNVAVRDTSKFINFINRGGLTYPSTNINLIVKITNTCLNNHSHLILKDKYLVSRITHNVISVLEYKSPKMFACLDDHVDPGMESHRIGLIKKIISSFLKIKLRHFCKEINSQHNKRIRRSMTKTILFQSQ